MQAGHQGFGDRDPRAEVADSIGVGVVDDIAIEQVSVASGAPVVAVSPIIGGQAVKGPTAKMMRELGLEASAAGVAARYGDLLDGYIVDHADSGGVGNVGARVTIARTLMTSLHEREMLARVTLDAADALAMLR